MVYERLNEENYQVLAPLCNELMKFQQSKAYIKPELFNQMSYETRLVPSVQGALHNHFFIAREGEEIIAYAYSNISHKDVYDSEMFGEFFDMDSVSGNYVGCLSQFYIKDEYRGKGIGSKLFSDAIEWMKSFENIDDLFIYVSNGNNNALEFYKSKGFVVSHDISDGFITVLRNK